MTPITGASETLPAVLWDNGGESYNVRHPDYNATGLGSADDRAAFVAVEAVSTWTTVPAGTYRIASNLTIAKPIKMAAGAIIKPDSGVTVTISGAFRAQMVKCFDLSAGGLIAISPLATHIIYPEWWGALGDRTTDDIVALQACADCALTANDLGGTMKIRCTRGYRHSKSWRLFRWSAGTFTYSTVEVEFATRSYLTGKGAELIPTMQNQPAIVIHAARATVIRNPTIRGPVATVGPTYANMLADTGGTAGTPWYNSGNLARDTQYSPQCGISVDPFFTSLPSDGGYPGLNGTGGTNYYTDTKGSSIVDIVAPRISNCIVGIALSTSNGTQNNDAVRITGNPNFELCKVPVAVGQSQNRGVYIENPYVLYARTAFDAASYGAGNAAFPVITGGVVTGGCKWLFYGNGTFASGSITNLYAESLMSLGFWNWTGSGYALTLDNVQVTFADNSVAALGSGQEPDVHLHAAGPVIFRGGYYSWLIDNSYRRMAIYNAALMQFDGVSLDGEPQFASPNLVRWVSHCPLRWSGSGANYGISDRMHNNPAVVGFSSTEAKIAPFGEVMDGNGTNLTRFRWRGYSNSVSLSGAVTITVATNGTGTLTDATVAARVQVGDWITINTAIAAEKPVSTLSTINYTSTQLAKVTATNTGTGAVTLGRLPKSMVTGTFSIQLDRYPLFRQRTVGTTISGNNGVTGVTPLTAWAVGNRIDSPNFPAGTTVTGVGSGTLTLSQNATASGLAEFYDGRLVLESATMNAVPSTGVWFRGDFIAFGAGSAKDANGLVLRGWVCTASGSPGSWEPQYGGTTTPAALTQGLATVTYSASMTPDASLGDEQTITITDAVAHAINAPTNPTSGQRLTLMLRNTSGGAAGVATWNAVFKMTAWTQPATGFSRSITFRYNGTNWVETTRTAADVPN